MTEQSLKKARELLAQAREHEQKANKLYYRHIVELMRDKDDPRLYYSLAADDYWKALNSLDANDMQGNADLAVELAEGSVRAAANSFTSAMNHLARFPHLYSMSAGINSGFLSLGNIDDEEVLKKALAKLYEIVAALSGDSKLYDRFVEPQLAGLETQIVGAIQGLRRRLGYDQCEVYEKVLLRRSDDDG